MKGAQRPANATWMIGNPQVRVAHGTSRASMGRKRLPQEHGKSPERPQPGLRNPLDLPREDTTIVVTAP